MKKENNKKDDIMIYQMRVYDKVDTTLVVGIYEGEEGAMFRKDGSLTLFCRKGMQEAMKNGQRVEFVKLG